MKKLFGTFVIVLIYTILFSSESQGDWPNIGGDLQHSGYTDSQPVPFELRWKYKVGNSDISAPVIDAGILFIGSDDSNLYAIDSMSGKLKWQYSTFGNVYTPTARNGMVFAASFDNYIYSIDYNGKLKWKYNAGTSVASPSVVYNDILYGGSGRYIYAIYITNGSLYWKYATDGWVKSTPAISQGIVYTGSDDGYIYALDAESKNLKWKYKTGGSIISSPSVINGKVYIGSKDNSIYAIDSSSGELKWSKKTNDWVQSSAAVFGKSVYIGSNDNTLYALNTDSGDIIWRFKTSDWVNSPPLVVKDTVYAGSKDGTIYALDAAKGILISKYTIGSEIISLAFSDNTLFAAARDGYIYAFGVPIPIETSVPVVPVDRTPPDLKINPVPLNVTSEKLTISGTASDPNGVLVVTVNGAYAGTTSWNSTLILSNGTNNITIVAVDTAGNIRTEYRTVTYVPAATPQETPYPKTPGFYSLYSLIGLILALYKTKLKRNSLNEHKS